jgi:hypothetical protein
MRVLAVWQASHRALLQSDRWQADDFVLQHYRAHDLPLHLCTLLECADRSCTCTHAAFKGKQTGQQVEAAAANMHQG